jgi:photosystem II stability/assembly factor-like uncharacterized protein
MFTFKAMRIRLLLFLLSISPFLSAQKPAALADSLRSGFRGLSITADNTIWMSGRKGLVGVSKEVGGKWKWMRVKGFESSDFRSIHAFNKEKAVIATAGFPAAILYTSNSGKSWSTEFISNDSAMFFDGIDFWDENHGLIFGDPVKGRMYLAETMDGGKTWKEIPFEQRPVLQEGEASFAASGTTIQTYAGGHVWIATGGAVSRLWHSRDYGHHWEAAAAPILQGKPSQGIFSFSFLDTLHGVITGGDYSVDTLRDKNCFYTNDGGKTWSSPCITTNGYRSCVKYILGEMLIATGTSGTDISYDGGAHWQQMESGTGYNTIVVRPYGEVYLAGGKKKKLEHFAFK